MNTAFKNLSDIYSYFKDEQACRTYLEQQRWPTGVITCPFCDCQKVYRFSDGKRFKCADKFCNKKFTVTVGTIYENSKIPLSKWFLAVYIASSHKKGISSLQLSRDLGITQKTAWFVLHRVRDMLREKAPHQLKNVVEIDESFVGGKNKNRHADKKVRGTQGRSWKDKTPVLGILERHGNVRAIVTNDTRLTTLYPIMVDNIEKGSIMVSDEWYHQKTFNPDYSHVILNHKDDEYVRGAFHTNTIEGFWSLLKRGIYGIYHQVSPKHLQRYCDEFSYRYNTRKIADNDRFELSIKNSAGRLKYKDLVNKL